ncbi:hypothetical protein Pint_27381 [Pistacia integerrima]|uniref:Uncharacterized protein n=1 Tax=Pistacia integerrima TaxID=434235 RepID=A0ACC0YUF9_9ROSI|nr:hypothetical protein Pint_27381 [Pistacia integerrima]
MALGKYSRIDNRRSSSSYWPTVTVVVFVALCLVGVWMMTSSSMAPVQNVDEPAQEKKSEAREQVVESNESSTQQFEDNTGDLPEDATKGDSSVQNENNGNIQENDEKSNEETKSVDGSNIETQNNESKTDDGASKTEENSESGETKTDAGEGNSEENSNENEKKTDTDENEIKSEENSDNMKDGEKVDGQIQEKVDQNDDKEPEKSSDDKKEDEQSKNQSSNEVFPSGAQLELSKESATQNGSWSTQATESKNEKEAQLSSANQSGYNWKLCNTTAGFDYIPCLDNIQAIKSLRSTKHYEHRERHCPEEPPTCLVPLPEGYRRSIKWPTSREKIWYYNVPHTKLAVVKGHQNWVKVDGEYLTFPGGGTQFKHGALHYIDFINEVSNSIDDFCWLLCMLV